MCIYRLITKLFPCFHVQDDEERDVYELHSTPNEEEKRTPPEDNKEDMQEISTDQGEETVDEESDDEEDEKKEEELFAELSEEQKFDMVMKVINMYNLNELSDFISCMYPDISINDESTIPSLSIALVEYMYLNYSEQFISNTMERVRVLVNDLETNINQLHHRFQRLRNVLKSRFGENSLVVLQHKTCGGMTKGQFLIRKTLQEDNLKFKLENRVQVDKFEGLNIIRDTAFSDDIYDNIIALMLSTGCRFIEAVRISNFTESIKGDDYINVDGIAKQDKGGIQNIDRPLFGLNSTEVIELQYRIRRELSEEYPCITNMTNQNLTQVVSRRVNKRIKMLGIKGVDSSHMLRKLYTNLTYEALDDEKKDSTEFHSHIQNVLGHNKVGSAIPYSVVNLKDSTYQNIKEVMDELHRRGVKITEVILKRDYKFGSKTISAMSEYKKQLNAKL